jgi:hypothetical protein
MSAAVSFAAITLATRSEDNLRHKVGMEILVSGYVEAYIEFFNVTGMFISPHTLFI